MSMHVDTEFEIKKTKGIQRYASVNVTATTNYAPIIKPKNVDENENIDSLEIKQPKNSEKTQKQANIGQIKQTIRMFCDRYNINYNELVRNLLRKLKISIQDFETQFTKEQQADLLSLLQKSLEIYTELKINGKLQKEENATNFIIHTSVDLFEFSNVKKKCEENNIDFNKIKERLSVIFSNENFEKLSVRDTRKLYVIINQSVNRYIDAKKNNELAKEVDVYEYVIQDIKNIIEANEDGTWITREEIQAKEKDFWAFVGEDFKNLSPSEKDKKFKEYRTKSDSDFKAYLEAQLANVPEKERANEKRKLIARRDAIEVILMHKLVASLEKENVPSVGHIAHGKNLAKLPEELKIRNDAEEIANSIDMKCTASYYKTNYEAKEPIDAECALDFNTGLVALKSKDKAYLYQQQYVEMRNNQNRPEYMTEELFTATAAGIGAGVQINENMTANDKAVFMSKFEADEKQFGDLDKVTQMADKQVEKYVKENPEKLNIIKEYKQTKKYLSESSQAKTPQEKEEALKRLYSEEQTTVPRARALRARGYENDKYVSDPLATKAVQNGKLIVEDLRTQNTTVSKAVNEYGLGKVIKALNNAHCINIYESELKIYIKNATAENLMGEYNQGTAEFIDTNAKPDVARELFDKYKETLTSELRNMLEQRHKKVRLCNR